MASANAMSSAKRPRACHLTSEPKKTLMALTNRRLVSRSKETGCSAMRERWPSYPLAATPRRDTSPGPTARHDATVGRKHASVPDCRLLLLVGRGGGEVLVIP